MSPAVVAGGGRASGAAGASAPAEAGPRLPAIWRVWCPARGIAEEHAIELTAALEQRPDTIARCLDLPPGRWTVFVEDPDERVHRVEVRR